MAISTTYRITNMDKTAFDLGVEYAMEKEALVGPLLEAANLGLPSGLGYMVGADMRPPGEEAAKRRLKDRYSITKGLFVPGYTGYRAGKREAAREYLADSKSRKKEAGIKRNLQAGLLAASMAAGGGGAAQLGHAAGKAVQKAPITQVVKRKAGELLSPAAKAGAEAAKKAKGRSATETVKRVAGGGIGGLGY
jgi:hypothetical protein